MARTETQPKPFTLRERVASTEKKQKSKTIEGPLGELIEDKKAVSTFAFYFKRIITGQVASAEELEARFNNKLGFYSEFDKTYRLVGKDGYAARNKNGIIEISRDEQMPLSDPQQQKSLIQLFTDLNQMEPFNLYFRKIIAGEIESTKELKARFDNSEPSLELLIRTKSYTGKDQLELYRDKNGYTIELPPKERINLDDPDKKEVLLQLFKQLSSAEAFTFFIKKVASGGVETRNELRARFKNRITQGIILLALETDDTYYAKDKKGNTIRVPADEQFKITDRHQQQLLLQLLEQVTAEEPFDFYKKLVLSGRVTNSEELTARINNRIDNQDDTSYYVRLLDNKGNPLKEEEGKFITIYRDELLEVTDPKQRDAIECLFTIKNSTNIPDETKNLIGSYVTADNPEDRNRIKEKLKKKRTGAEQIADVITKFDIVNRKIDFKKKIFNTLLGGSAEEALALIGSFEQTDAQDQALVKELATITLASRREEVTRDALTNLLTNEGTIAEQLSRLGTLAKSSDKDDQASAQTVAQILYKLEFETNRNNVAQKIAEGTSTQDVLRYIDSLPTRPSIGNFDSVEAKRDLKEKTKIITASIESTDRLQKANTLREKFGKRSVKYILSEIDSLSDEAQEDQALKYQLLNLYKDFISTNKPEEFEKFGQEIEQTIKTELGERFEQPELGNNKEAFLYIRENYQASIYPLVESFRDDPRTRDKVQKTLKSRSKYIQRLKELEKQRPLSEIERSYIESTQLLSLFNPRLIAAVNANEGVTSEFLRHHFDTISAKTAEGLKDGDYVPLIQVGTGPNGLASLGEIVRNNPELARQMLVVDSGEQPGGPFAIPKGPAWELNSANRRGTEGYTLPDSQNGNELKTVRGYGSPVSRWYPGERVKNSNIRQGSINTTVDYLPTPDDLSSKRYPTNEELQLILSLQTALLTKNVALRTEVIKQEPNPNKNEKGDKIATLKITNKDGEDRIVRVKADAVFDLSGLGEAGYGFNLKGSKAEKVIEQTKDAKGFPKISTTLEAFQAFADRTKEKQSPGRTLAIWGKGNSADTLIEFIGNIFQGDNPLVRDVTKIYIISDGDLSKRPRYSLISDLKPRNGQGNLIEQVNARVADVDFANRKGKPEDRQLMLYDKDNNIIKDNSGQPILADAGIAATGFRPQRNNVYENFLTGDDALQPLTLPTNPEVSVADFLKTDPNVIFMGTASQPRFDSLAKLSQLPKEAREALLRNGAENAVAIGFRAPDTQAAVNIWLNSREVNLESSKKRELPKIPLTGGSFNDSALLLNYEKFKNITLPDNIESEEIFLSPLLSYNLGNSIKLTENYTGNIALDLKNGREGFALSRSKEDRSKTGGEFLSRRFLQELQEAVEDNDFQTYAMSLLGKRRGEPRLNLNIAFKNGKIDPQKTFVQAG